MWHDGIVIKIQRQRPHRALRLENRRDEHTDVRRIRKWTWVTNWKPVGVRSLQHTEENTSHDGNTVEEHCARADPVRLKASSRIAPSAQY